MSITLTLVLIIMTGLISFQAFSNQSMKQKLMMHPSTVKHQGEYFRFLTNGFVHADWGHLLINMYVLYIFGEAIEGNFNALFGDVMGRILFLGLYLGSIIFGAMPSFFKHQNNPSYAALGASGGTSGVVLAFVIFYPWEWFIFPPLPAALFAVAYLWYSSYMGKKGGGNIAHDAHFWGAVFGFLFCLTMIFIFRSDAISILMDRWMAGPSMPRF